MEKINFDEFISNMNDGQKSTKDITEKELSSVGHEDWYMRRKHNLSMWIDGSERDLFSSQAIEELEEETEDEVKELVKKEIERVKRKALRSAKSKWFLKDYPEYKDLDDRTLRLTTGFNELVEEYLKYEGGEEELSLKVWDKICDKKLEGKRLQIFRETLKELNLRADELVSKKQDDMSETFRKAVERGLFKAEEIFNLERVKRLLTDQNEKRVGKFLWHCRYCYFFTTKKGEDIFWDRKDGEWIRG